MSWEREDERSEIDPTRLDVLWGRVLDPQGIEVFLAIERTGTLSEAADRLYLSQSTVSTRLKNLEQALGVRLVDRGRGRQTARLTSAGERFHQVARRWLLIADELGRLRSQREVVVIGAPDSVTNHLLQDAFLEVTKSLNLRVVTANSTELLAMLAQHDIDMAFVLYSRPDPGLLVKKLFSERMVAISNAQHDTSTGIISPTVLDAEVGIHISWSPAYERWHRTQWDPAQFRIQVDVAHTADRLMVGPRNWIIAPVSSAQAMRRSGRFVYDLDPAPPDRSIELVVRATPTPRVERVVSVVEESLEGLDLTKSAH